MPPAAKLGSIHACDDDESRRQLPMGMFSEPFVPGMRKCDVRRVVRDRTVDHENEQVRIGRGSHRRLSLVAIALGLWDV